MYGLHMGDGREPPKPTPARMALAANVKHLMDNYPKGFDKGITAPELEKGCGISAKTIRRIINPYEDIDPRLGTLDAIAWFFQVPTAELIRPRDLLHRTEPPNPRPTAPVKRKT